MKNQSELMALKAEILKALGHPTRLLMIEVLSKGERCVCELNEIVPADHSTISKHLSILKQAGLVYDRKDGLRVYYRLACPCIMEFLGSVNKVIEFRAKKDLAALNERKTYANR